MAPSRRWWTIRRAPSPSSRPWVYAIRTATKYRDINPAQIPIKIIVNGLGGLAQGEMGSDRFDVELGAGDLLLLCSRRMEVPEEEVARIARADVDDGAPLDELARTLERRSAAMLDSPKAHDVSEVAFALALARRLAG